MALDLVSVVVPTYNQAKYIPACLDRLLLQDYPALEIVVVDDASTDGTSEVLDAYLRSAKEDAVSFASRWDGREVVRETHPRFPRAREIRVVRNAANLGATRAYNAGMSRVRGTYATFVPSDDLPHPTFVSELVGALDRGADFAYADMWIVDDAGRVLREFRLPDYSFDRCFGDWYLCGAAKLFRADLLRSVGLFDERFAVANDHELFLRFAMSGARFVHVPRVLYSVRFHGADRQTGQHSAGSTRRMFEESIELVERARASSPPSPS
ncbi:MAG: glycosyltransferase [Planctomycetes bacterium]|nr:glycosyltransferase [Planctomycetota bacterium]